MNKRNDDDDDDDEKFHSFQIHFRSHQIDSWMAGHSPIKLLKMFSLSEESVVLPPSTIPIIFIFLFVLRERMKIWYKSA